MEKKKQESKVKKEKETKLKEEKEKGLKEKETKEQKIKEEKEKEIREQKVKEDKEKEIREQKVKEDKEKDIGYKMHFVPIPESTGKDFQMDDYGNFRIIVDDKKSEWAGYQGIAALKIGEKLYIGVSEYFKGYIPTECVLKVERRDDIHKKEDEGFVKVKIVDKDKGQPLDMEEIEDILDNVLLQKEFSFTVEPME